MAKSLLSLPFLIAGLIFLSCLPSRIDIGLRHILPIYPMLAITAAIAVGSALGTSRAIRPWAIVVVVALLGCQLVRTWQTHPDYLTYFNGLAGHDPEMILVDSDYDWGQENGLVAQWASANHVHSLGVALHGRPPYKLMEFPPVKQVRPFRPVSGVIAISASRLRSGTDINGAIPKRGAGGFDWLLQYEPTARLGKTIRIYDITESQAAKAKAEIGPDPKNAPLMNWVIPGED